MKYVPSLVPALAFVAGIASAGEPALDTPGKKLSYAIGRQVGESLTRQGMQTDVDADTLCAAIREALSGKESSMDQAEVARVMMEFRKKIRAKMEQTMSRKGTANVTAGKAFLKANAAKPGWTTTASGLQYKVVKQGKGAKPSATDKVKVHYRGSLIDGKEFDSSYKRGQPAEFPVNGVIKGWTEALQLMPVGSKWELVIPSDLAYGKRGAGRDIGPDAVLKFEVELLDINK